MAQEQNRGKGARKVELEKRLDANAEVERREFRTSRSGTPARKGPGAGSGAGRSRGAR